MTAAAAARTRVWLLLAVALTLVGATLGLLGTGVAAAESPGPDLVGVIDDIGPGEGREVGSVSYDLASGCCVATRGVNNPVPSRVSRVVDEDVLDRGVTTLGHPSDADVFVTGADDISGMSSAQIGERLSLFDASGAPRKGPFAVIEFDVPAGIASPINRTNPGFVGQGLTGGGAREFVVPNQSIDDLMNVVIRRPG